jgi:hypothetical protein
MLELSRSLDRDKLAALIPARNDEELDWLFPSRLMGG